MSWSIEKKSKLTPKPQVNAAPTLVRSVREGVASRKFDDEACDKVEEDIKECRDQISKCVGRVDIRKKRDLEEELQKMEDKLKHMRDNTQLDNYENSVRPFLQAYQREREIGEIEKITGKDLFAPPPPTTAKPSKKTPRVELGNFICTDGRVTKRSKVAVVSEEIAADMLKTVDDAAPTVQIIQDDVCEDCGKTMFIVQQYNLLSCTCGASRTYFDTSAASVGYGEDVEYTCFSYQRVNHFNEWLTNFQAKETTRVPDEIICSVKEEMKKTRVKLKTSTMKNVLTVLQRLKLRTYYGRLTQIWCRVTGNAPPRMSAEQEEKCRLMFKAIQIPFERHKPPTRRNFLSYPYCLYKFTELLGYFDYLKYFTLLKGADKLDAQDNIFHKICDDMQWEFRKSR